MSKEIIIQKDIVDIQKENRLDFFLSLMYSRAIADIRDGLKPVHRRILYTTKEMGIYSNKPYRKSAAVVGNTMGK